MSERLTPTSGAAPEADGPWLHADPLPGAHGTHWLSREEARHATGSRRLHAGDAVTLFDGRGGIARGSLGESRRGDGALEVAVGPAQRVARAGRAVRIACAVPKGDRLATLLEALAPLGVEEIVPLRTERGVVPWSAHLAQRAQRICVECAKQSRSAWVPALCEPASAADAAREGASRGELLIADRSGPPLAACAAALPQDCRVTVLVGPEGGFTDAERAAAVAAGAAPVSLGPAVLRIELAASVAATLLRLA